MRRFLTFLRADSVLNSVPNSPSDPQSSPGGSEGELDTVVDADELDLPSNEGASQDNNGATTASEEGVDVQDKGADSERWGVDGSAVAPKTATLRKRNGDVSVEPLQWLKEIVDVLRFYSDNDLSDARKADGGVVSALKDLAEIMVWADQNDTVVWDAFLEYAIMPLLVRCLRKTAEEISAPTTTATVENSELPKGEATEVQANVGSDGMQKRVEEEFASLDTSPGEVANGAHSPVDGFDKEFTRDRSTQLDDISESEEVSPKAATAAKGFHEPGTVEQEAGLNGIATEHDSGVEGDSDDFETKHLPSRTEKPADLQAQILQTISILIQSVSKQQSLLCLFSSNHINDILSFDFDFDHEEMVAYFMSAVKSIALKLDAGLLQLFFDPMKGSFPLYTVVTRFYDHPESMVRIAVRNVTLTIYALGDSEALRFAAKDETLYFQKTTELLAKLCGSVARAFELLLDDGREVRRTRSRTGLFKRRVKVQELTAKLEEIEDLCAYLGEVSTVSQSYLHPLVVNLTSSRLFSPFFRPLASQASPEAMRLLRKKWGISRSTSDLETQPAIPLFDAAARSLVLACILSHCRSSPLGSVLVRDLYRPTSEFEHRHVLHGLKAMATDIAGTERVAFISLCTIEAFITCEAATKQLLTSLRYDFYLDDAEDVSGPALNGVSTPVINIGMPDEDDLERRGVEPLLMTLSDFEAPLTPTNSRPSTPTLPKMASMTSMDGIKTPPNGFNLDSRMPSVDSSGAFSLSPPVTTSKSVERSDSDGILSAFQRGEATLREAISSIILVVRRREIRTLRVLHRVARIIRAVQKRTSDANASVDLTKIVLDELAGVIHGFLKNKRTTIVSIEQMFDNFRTVCESNSIFLQDDWEVETILSPDTLPIIAAYFPKGTGKRRRVHTDDAAPPVEIEDANAFFIIAKVYDDSLRAAKVLDRVGSLSKRIHEILTENGVEDSYLDKRDALLDVSDAVRKHGEVA